MPQCVQRENGMLEAAVVIGVAEGPVGAAGGAHPLTTAKAAAAAPMLRTVEPDGGDWLLWFWWFAC